MPYASIAELPDYIKKRSRAKQKRWLAIWNDVYGRTGSEEKAFKAANAALKQGDDDMNIKDIVQSRLALLDALLQAGKRLSTATIEKIKATIAGLNELIGEEDSEPTVEAVEQAWAPMGIEFSNLHEVSLEQAIVLLESAVIEGDAALEQARKDMWDANKKRDAKKQDAPPVSWLLEQANGGLPLLLQVLPGSVTLCQEKTSDGRLIFEGIATHGNILNLNNPPVVFPTELWASELPRVQGLIAQGRFYGTLGHKVDDHGRGRRPEPDELSHKFTDMSQDGDLFPFKAEALPTSAGRELQALLASDVALDMSTVASGKTKKVEWNGQSAYVVQKQGFEWHSVDIVLQGASPGAQITDARLQALNAEEPREGTAMTEEEIKALIAQTQGTGNEALVAQLQALQAKIASLEQNKPALTDEDKALLEQAKAIVTKDEERVKLQARDDKAKEIVDKMIADKEVPTQFARMATLQFQSLCQSADDVEGKKATVLSLMSDTLEQHKLLQSKGFYVSEHNDDGTSRKLLETPEDVISDIMQSAETRGVLPKDTGIDDPSNMNRNARIMLQTMAEERPVYAESYAAWKNRTIRNPAGMLNFLQTKFNMLTQDIPTGAMTTTDVAAAIPFLMKTVTELLPQLLAGRYCSVQPTPKSKATIAYWKIKDENGNLIHAAQGANFTGSYTNDPGEKQKIKKLKGALTTTSIDVEAQKLGFDLSIEVIKRLRTDWGMDASSVMLGECANEIAMELNYQDLANMVAGATAGNWIYGTTIPTGGAFDGEQWQRQIMNYLGSVRAGIFKRTFAGTVAILGDADAIARILWLSKEVGQLSATPGAGIIARGVNIAGLLTTGEELVSIGWWENLGLSNKLLVIGRGNEWYRSGYITTPYGGPYVSPPWVDPETLDYMQAMMVETKGTMVNGDYYATLSINASAGIPL